MHVKVHDEVFDREDVGVVTDDGVATLSVEADAEDDNDVAEDEEASAGVEVEEERVVEAATLVKSSISTRLDVIVRRILWYLLSNCCLWS